MLASQTEEEKPFRIIIVGGGIAGLALAHGLARLRTPRSVQVTVIEKRTNASRFTGYPIHLSPSGREALRYLLSREEFEKLVSNSDFGIEHGGISIVSSGFRKRFAARQFEGCWPLFVQRMDLRTALGFGVDVRVGELVDFVNDGVMVRVLFGDGSEERADLVVGADGIGSSIRAKLHPTLDRVPTLPYLTISSKLTHSGKLPLPDSKGINLVLGQANFTILLVPLQAPADYIYAIATIPVFEDWRLANDWRQRIVSLLKADQAHASLIDAVENDWIPESEGVWQDACMDRRCLPPYVDGKVVLIGDAAHTMPPYGGVGASLAIQDAQDLCVALEQSDVFGGKVPLALAMKDFHTTIMKRAKINLKDAQRKMSLSLRSGYGVYFQTAILRLMSLTWPLLSLFPPLRPDRQSRAA